MRLIATSDEQAQKRQKGVVDMAVLRWDKVKEYIGSAADSVKTTPSVVV